MVRIARGGGLYSEDRGGGCTVRIYRGWGGGCTVRIGAGGCTGRGLYSEDI